MKMKKKINKIIGLLNIINSLIIIIVNNSNQILVKPMKKM